MSLDSIFELPLLVMQGIFNSDTSNDQRLGETSFEDCNDVLAVHGVLRYVGVDLTRRLTFSSFRTIKFARCCFSLGFGAMFGMSRNSV